tara:strand:- start:651 stop:761 length:111 start_codon:yes stop_codon:yes gene_type:complete
LLEVEEVDLQVVVQVVAVELEVLEPFQVYPFLVIQL